MSDRPEALRAPTSAMGRLSRLALVERERQVLAEIAAGVPLGKVLEDLLLAVEAESGNAMRTSVLFLSEDGSRMLHGAAPNLPEAYNRIVDGLPSGFGVGSCGTAAALGQPVYVTDIATDPLWRDFRDLALGYGLRACWSSPITSADGKVLGTFAVYYDTKRAPGQDDIDAISFVAQTAALAIERHRSDQSLRRSRDELRALNADLERQVTERAHERSRIWQLSPDMLGVLNAEGWLETSNPAWEKVLGWSAADIRSAPLSTFLHPGDLAGSRAAFDTIGSGNPVFQFESRFRAKAGGFRWLSWTALPEEGKCYFSARDVTREKEQAEALNRTWQLSQELLLVARPSGTIASVNPTWTQLLGWSSSELVGSSFVSYIHPDDFSATRAAVERLVKAPLVVPFEHRLRHKDGSYRWFAWTGTFEDDKVYASGRDVTQDHEREAVLRDTQDFARLALSAVGGVGVWTYEVAGDLFFYDRFIADLYAIDPACGSGGLPRAAFLANVHPEDRAALATTMQGGLVQPGDLELEYRICHPGGIVRWVLSRGHTYHDESGVPVRRTGVGVETTAQRETEEALRQSQKMEAVGQLTGGVAHDFNNLLTVIRSSVDLLKRPNLTEERRERYIGAISDTVDRAARLTGQLLAFARRQALKPEIFAVCDAVRAIADMLGTLTGARIDIVTRLPEQACWIDADPSQFDTALVNMAVNARDAMEGQGRLTITVAPAEMMPAMRSRGAITGHFVAVSIADTGTGIPPERLGKIFEPFYTTKGVGQGTGLGLSQVFGFAKQSGGEVTVTSEVGKGTIFTLYLPRMAAPASKTQAPGEPEPLADGHGTCVLVVEDNADVGAFAIQALAELGYVTAFSANAEEALAVLANEANRFDVVFTDVVMPGMNGMDLAQAIRRDHGDLPVVLTSGYSHVLAQNGTLGFELLHKPYSIEELSRVLRKVADWKRRKRIMRHQFGPRSSQA